MVNFLQSTAASDLDVSVGNKAEVVFLDDGDSRGVESAGVLGNVVVLNSNLYNSGQVSKIQLKQNQYL